MLKKIMFLPLPSCYKNLFLVILIAFNFSELYTINLIEMSQPQGGAPQGVMNGGAPTAQDLQAQQEATEFLSNIMMEVREHDMQQAEAMQNYLRKLKFWQRWSIFGGKNLPSNLTVGGDVTGAQSKAEVVSTKETLKDGSVVERSRATTASPIDRAALTGAAAAAAKAAEAAENARYSPYLFKKVNPHYVPILQRWWIPYVSVLGLFIVWSPDAWKLRTLYYLDWRYEQLKTGVHKVYWKATMPADQYEILCKQIEENVNKNKRIKSPDCPF